MGKPRLRSTAELREAARSTFFSSQDRVNDLCNNALGYYEKYREDVPKGLIETAYVNFWTCHYILVDVIPHHSGFKQFCAKKSSFSEVYNALRSMVEKDIVGDIAKLEKYLAERDDSHGNEPTAANAPNNENNPDTQDASDINHNNNNTTTTERKINHTLKEDVPPKVNGHNHVIANGSVSDLDIADPTTEHSNNYNSDTTNIHIHPQGYGTPSEESTKPKHSVHRRPVGAGSSKSPPLGPPPPAPTSTTFSSRIESTDSISTVPLPETPPPPVPREDDNIEDPLAARFERLRGPRPLLERNSRRKSSAFASSNSSATNLSSGSESAYSPYLMSSSAGTTNMTNGLVYELNNTTRDVSSSSSVAQSRPNLPPISTSMTSSPRQAIYTSNQQSSSSVVSTNKYGSPIIFPRATVVNAESLYKYLQTAPDLVLVLDVRDRRSFERGHIAAPNIVCIEPAGLRENMNDQALEDSLVIGPDEEQALFAKRGSFELVVYYDSDSRSSKGGPESDTQAATIRNLTNAIYARAFAHPLKRPPCLLVGGFESWLEAYNGKYVVKTVVASQPATSRNSLPAGQRYRSSSKSYVSDFQHQNRIRSHSMNSGPVTPPQEIRSRDSYDFQSYGSSGPQSPDVTPSSPLTATGGGAAIGAGYAKDYNDYFRNFSSFAANSQPALPYPTQASTNSMPMPMPNYVTKPHPIAPAGSPYPLPRSSQLQASPLPPHSQSGYMASLPSLPVSTSRSPADSVLSSTAGLRNLGNTCYMNCILQCLIGTAPISVIFADSSWKQYVNVHSRLGYKGILAQRYAELVQTMAKDSVASVGPHALKNLSGRLRDIFQGYEQQDCQEFLTFILDGLHEELNANGDKEPLRQPTAEEERRREKMSVRVASTLEWERYMKSDLSPIVHTVQGQYQSKLRCMSCNHTSTTYNAFSFLSLPIPLSGRQVTLQDCFNLFTAEEILDGDDAWFCPQCKKRRRTAKVLHIVRLPKILIIHLKRFQQRRGGVISDKLETFVTYPLKGLDLTPYWPNYADGDEQSLVGVPIRGQNAPFIYDLYGVANHFGTLKGGHYTAFVKKAQKGWCYFDDVRVSKNISPTECVNRHAYVLFYERREALR